MEFALTDGGFAVLVGLGGGLILGLSARLGRFCTMGAIEDTLYADDTTRLRMWGVAIGVAILGSFGLIQAGLLDVALTPYFQTPFSPLAAILGGLLFGYGMALAGNCGFGALARLGGGDLRAFVIVLVLGISSYIALSGPLASARVALVEGTALNLGAARDYPHLLSAATGIPAVGFAAVIGLGILAGCVLWGKDALIQNPRSIFWGTWVGLAVVSGWAGTSWVYAHSFGAEPVADHTFSAPVGETLIYLMTASGGGLSFGVGSVMGVIAGALVGSMIKGHFRWEACEDPRELRRQISGAAMMGLGAVLATGCTIGQGISAFSVLSFSAPLVFGSIFLGAAIGLRQLIEGFTPAE